MTVCITILDWDNYNPRKDRKIYGWVRLECDTYNSPKLFNLDHEGKWVWITLLCLLGKTNIAQHSVNIDWLAHNAGVSKEKCLNALRILNGELIELIEEKEVVEVGNQLVTSGNQMVAVGNQLPPKCHPTRREETIRDDTRRNETNEKKYKVPNPKKPGVRNLHFLELPDQILGNWIWEKAVVTKEQILEVYQDRAWIEDQCKEIAVWCQTNRDRSRRSQRGWTQFVNRWLKKAWDQHPPKSQKEKDEAAKKAENQRLLNAPWPEDAWT